MATSPARMEREGTRSPGQVLAAAVAAARSRAGARPGASRCGMRGARCGPRARSSGQPACSRWRSFGRRAPTRSSSTRPALHERRSGRSATCSSRRPPAGTPSGTSRSRTTATSSRRAPRSSRFIRCSRASAGCPARLDAARRRARVSLAALRWWRCTCCTGWPTLELGREHARAGRCCWSRCFPTAFFFSAVYSESLFLALSVGRGLRRAAGATGRGPGVLGRAGGVDAQRRRAGRRPDRAALSLRAARRPAGARRARVAPALPGARRPRVGRARAGRPASRSSATCSGGPASRWRPSTRRTSGSATSRGRSAGAWDGVVAAVRRRPPARLRARATHVYFTAGGRGPVRRRAAQPRRRRLPRASRSWRPVGALRRLPLAYGAYALVAARAAALLPGLAASR